MSEKETSEALRHRNQAQLRAMQQIAEANAHFREGRPYVHGPASCSFVGVFGASLLQNLEATIEGQRICLPDDVWLFGPSVAGGTSTGKLWLYVPLDRFLKSSVRIAAYYVSFVAAGCVIKFYQGTLGLSQTARYEGTGIGVWGGEGHGQSQFKKC